MYIGVDIGGTNIVSGLVSKEGFLIDSISIPTEVSLGSDLIIKRISESIDKLIENNKIKSAQVKSVGIGIPGIADPNGVILECVNLAWINVDIKSKLEKLNNIDVYVGNDATVAAIAEAHMGSLKDRGTGVLLTLGTGVGGGFIIDGRVYLGKHGIASEVGHMVVGENFYNCNCGRNGCLETYASATAAIKYAKKLLDEIGKDNAKSAFALEFAHKTDQITCKDVFDYAKENDVLAKKVVDRLVRYLTIGIINLMITIDMQVVSIGGGVAAAGDYLIDLIEKELEKERIFRSVDAPKIVLADMGNDAGVVGAALLELFN